jgi:hypothetical protein
MNAKTATIVIHVQRNTFLAMLILPSYPVGALGNFVTRFFVTAAAGEFRNAGALWKHKGRPDRRHKLRFEYLIIFWTTSEV